MVSVRSAATTVFFRRGPHAADVQGGADLVEVADADQDVELFAEHRLEDMTGGLGLRLAVVDQPLAHSGRQFVGIAVAMVDERVLTLQSHPPAQAMGGRFTGGDARRGGRLPPGESGIHARHQPCFGGAALLPIELG